MKRNIIIAGDLLPWSNNTKKFEQGEAIALFSQEICDLFANADFSILNLEGPLTNATKKQHKIGPAIKGSIEAANALRQLGVRCVALANNHITDFLNQGFEDTINMLKQSGINYVGAGRCGDMKTHISLDLDGKKVCVYNVSETFFNQPTKDFYGANLYDEYLVCNEIRELKKTHDYLIVIYHGGAEYLQYPSPQTRMRFHRMANCGANFITAQHTHCVGCEEYYNGSYLLHGQGNFSFAKQAEGKLICRQGLVCELIFEDGKITIQNHCVEMQSNGCLIYKGQEFLANFKERSNNINDLDLIEENYRKLKPFNIVDRYLSADKGILSFELKVKKRFFPKAYRKSMLNSYTLNDIERQYFVLSSDRAREDVLYMWQGIQKKYIK